MHDPLLDIPCVTIEGEQKRLADFDAKVLLVANTVNIGANLAAMGAAARLAGARGGAKSLKTGAGPLSPARPTVMRAIVYACGPRS